MCGWLRYCLRLLLAGLAAALLPLLASATVGLGGDGFATSWLLEPLPLPLPPLASLVCSSAACCSRRADYKLPD